MYSNRVYLRITQICEDAGYEVDRAYIDQYGEPRIGIFPKDRSFQSFYPSIYPQVEYDWKNHKAIFHGWKIQTTSYWSLSMDEYERMMDVQYGAMRMVKKLEGLNLDKLAHLPPKFDDDENS